MQSKKKILLKLTGEIFLTEQRTLTPAHINAIIEQIKQLSSTHQFGIVIGGGNFFRGRDQGVTLGMTASVGHQAGMLATMLNGLILKDLFEQHGIKTTLLCAITCPEVGESISHQAILGAAKNSSIIIFTGGTGNPFFTNDTNAVIRALQIEADEIWKGTNVPGVYDADPKKNAQAKLLKNVSYQEALDLNLGIMDATAFTLAKQHNQPLRIFDIFAENALIKAAHDKQFGSTIT